MVTATWTDDGAKTGHTDPAVVHYERQAEIVEHIARGLLAKDAGNDGTAFTDLRHAAELARASGHDDTAALLASVLDAESAGKADEMALATRSTRTLRLNQFPGSAPADPSA